MLPAVNRVGRAYAARRGLRSGERGSTNRSLSAMCLPILAARDHARTGGDAHARFHHDLPFRAKQDIHSRTEFDQPDTFAFSHIVAAFLGEHDAPRDQPGDLLEDDARSVPFDRDNVLLVLRRTDFPAGDQEFSTLILHIGDGSTDRRAVDVNIEDTQENADPVQSRGLRLHRDDFAIGRRNGYRTARNLTLRIAKEVKTKEREDPERRRKPWICQPQYQRARSGESESVINAVANYHLTLVYCDHGGLTPFIRA